MGPRTPSGASTHALAYDPGAEFYDEAFFFGGTLRPAYEPFIAGLTGVDLEALRRRVDTELASRGTAFRTDRGLHPFVVDPIPRLITRAEWEVLEAGVAQRVRALNAFLSDIYGERQIVRAGHIPRRVIETSAHYEAEAARIQVFGSMAAVAGLDIVRDVDGDFKVLEDNLRTPSGLAYLEAARDVLDECLPEDAVTRRRSLRGHTFERLDAALRAAKPDGVEDPSVVLLSDGPSTGAWFEHCVVSDRLSIPIVTPADLEVRRGRLHAWVGDSRRPVDVVYRRTNEDRLLGDDERPSPAAAALLEPLLGGRLGVVNAFGTGVADDKLLHGYVSEMVRFYLGEEPLLESVRTYDLADVDVRAAALERLAELVVKPRGGYGGRGVMIGSQSTAEDRERIAWAIRNRPDCYVVQETLKLSRHPTVSGGRLKPRHVDLRAFAFSVDDDVHVVPGGLTRVALDSGDLVVNSSQNGGGKDTWVLD